MQCFNKKFICGIFAGHYAYIDSSGKDNGAFARLSSPMFIKPAGQSGGCVQLYYYMYGADIGTLNISVYDNTQSGLVANFQRSGEIVDFSQILLKPSCCCL